jgi:ribosomal protein S18 acetylase RimI-like enzyme
VGRAWLYGPYGEGADELYAALRPRMPEKVQHELYCAAGNQAVIGFAGRHGFTASSSSLIYELNRDGLAGVPPASADRLEPERLEPALHDQFAARYQEIFPGAPYTPPTVAVRNPPPLVVVEDGHLLGFVTLRLTPEYGNGELEHIGVAEPARGRGLGRRLLAAAIHEAFRDPRLTTLCVNTNTVNAVGQRLYESVGFRRGRTMVSFRTPPP